MTGTLSLSRPRRQLRVESLHCHPQIAYQHHIPFGGAPQRALRPERLIVLCVDALPSKHLFEMLGEGFLDQAVFAVDICDHGCLLEAGRHSGHGPEGAIEVELRKISVAQYGFQL